MFEDFNFSFISFEKSQLSVSRVNFIPIHYFLISHSFHSIIFTLYSQYSNHFINESIVQQNSNCRIE